jgi:zinc transport system substrate-binding protein
MKNLFTALFVSLAFIIAGCGSDQESHSHGEDGDHTNETMAQPSTTNDSDAVRIGGDDHHSTEDDSTHAHDEEGDHNHGEDGDHTHEEDTHTHGDEEHSH